MLLFSIYLNNFLEEIINETAKIYHNASSHYLYHDFISKKPLWGFSILFSRYFLIDKKQNGSK